MGFFIDADKRIHPRYLAHFEKVARFTLSANAPLTVVSPKEVKVISLNRNVPGTMISFSTFPEGALTEFNRSSASLMREELKIETFVQKEFDVIPPVRILGKMIVKPSKLLMYAPRDEEDTNSFMLELLKYSTSRVKTAGGDCPYALHAGALMLFFFENPFINSEPTLEEQFRMMLVQRALEYPNIAFDVDDFINPFAQELLYGMVDGVRQTRAKILSEDLEREYRSKLAEAEHIGTRLVKARRDAEHIRPLNRLELPENITMMFSSSGITFQMKWGLMTIGKYNVPMQNYSVRVGSDSPPRVRPRSGSNYVSPYAFSSGEICFGTFSATAGDLLENGDYIGYAILLRNVLENYVEDSSPATTLSSAVEGHHIAIKDYGRYADPRKRDLALEELIDDEYNDDYDDIVIGSEDDADDELP